MKILKKLRYPIQKHYKKIIISLLCITFLFSFVCFPALGVSISVGPYSEKLTELQIYNRTQDCQVIVTYKDGTTVGYTAYSRYNGTNCTYTVWATVDVDKSNPIVGYEYYFICERFDEVTSNNPYFNSLSNFLNLKTTLNFDNNLYDRNREKYCDTYLKEIELYPYTVVPEVGFPATIKFNDFGNMDYWTNGRPENPIVFNGGKDLGSVYAYGNVLEMSFRFIVPGGATYKEWIGNADMDKAQIMLWFSEGISVSCYTSLTEVPQYSPPNDSTLNNALDLEANLLDSVGGDLDKLNSMFDDFSGSTIGNRVIYKPLQAIRNILNTFVDDDMFSSNVIGIIITFSLGIGMAGFVLNLASNFVSRVRNSNKGSKGGKGD